MFYYSTKELIEKITKADYNFDDDSWITVSQEAQNLVIGCLNLDFKKRFLPFVALMHEWITNVKSH